jgi:hypothetical protein
MPIPKSAIEAGSGTAALKTVLLFTATRSGDVVIDDTAITPAAGGKETLESKL